MLSAVTIFFHVHGSVGETSIVNSNKKRIETYNLFGRLSAE
jgi:hypothetical protein